MRKKKSRIDKKKRRSNRIDEGNKRDTGMRRVELISSGRVQE